MRRPVNAPYTVTSLHGEPVGNLAKFGKHTGYDYAVPLNRPVYSPVTGKVTFAGWSSTGGNMITILDGQFYHRLMHNNSVLVRVGDQVTEGQQIAKAGTTGLSTGVHVHWDICKKATATAFSDFVDSDVLLKASTKPSAPAQGGDMADANDVKAIYQYGPLGRTADPGGLKNYTGKKTDLILKEHAGSAEAKAKAAQLAKYKADAALVPGLKAEIAKLKASQGTGSNADTKYIRAKVDEILAFLKRIFK